MARKVAEIATTSDREDDKRRGRWGFTLVELLVVIAIIGVLVALLIPAVQAAREASRRADCINRLRQVALGALNYESAKQKIPPHGDDPQSLSSQARLLPYMEQQALMNLVDQNAHWRDAVNRKAFETPLPFMRCPSGKEIELTYMNERDNPGTALQNNLRCHYVGNMGARPGPNASGSVGDGCQPPGGGRGSGAWEYPESTYLQYSCSLRGSSSSSGGTAINGVIFPLSDLAIGDVSDGTSNTIMYGEMSWDVGPQEPWIVGSSTKNEGHENNSNGVVYNAKVMRWAINAENFINEDGTPNVRNVPLTETSYGSYHPGGAHFVLCDGSATFLRDEVDVAKILRPMASRSSEEVFERP
jgi:prepilin-type N-terminal cleavage/methylation domain-containing protein